MMVIDLQRTRDALAQLDQVLIDHPDLAGTSTAGQWTETLKGIFMENEKQVYTVAEAAALFECHPETIKRAIRIGKLSAAKIGRDFRLSKQELVRFWEDSGGKNLFPEK